MIYKREQFIMSKATTLNENIDMHICVLIADKRKNRNTLVVGDFNSIL